MLSPRGQAANAAAQGMAEALAEAWGMTWAPTPLDAPALVDGVFLRQGVLAAVAECKVRQHGREAMRQWGDEYLITAQKLEEGRRAARLLAVPFLLCVLLTPDRTADWWRVAHSDGTWALPFAQRVTATQRTVNGGSATRTNAFLPFAEARSLLLQGGAPARR